MTKTHLPIVPGALSFLDGIQYGGLDIGDIISKRSKRLRWGATLHSIAELGLSEFFPDVEQVKLLGSEQAKVAEALRQREQGPLVVTDDYPNKLGKEVLNQVAAVRRDGGNQPRHPLILGAVWTPHQHDRVASLVRYAELSLRTPVEREAGTSNLYLPEANLSVVRLHPYSFAEGQRLAEFAINLAKAQTAQDSGITDATNVVPLANYQDGAAVAGARAAFSGPPDFPGQ